MWIILLDSRTYAIGPFTYLFDAQQYAKSMGQPFVIKELIAPAQESAG